MNLMTHAVGQLCPCLKTDCLKEELVRIIFLSLITFEFSFKMCTKIDPVEEGLEVGDASISLLLMEKPDAGSS